MKSGPRQPAAMAPASTEVAYSAGRWNVYVCSLRASSKMTAPTWAASAVSQMVRAMSNVWARMLMAGTVNPWISPRARAMYSSWMLADHEEQDEHDAGAHEHAAQLNPPDDGGDLGWRAARSRRRRRRRELDQSLHGPALDKDRVRDNDDVDDDRHPQPAVLRRGHID